MLKKWKHCSFFSWNVFMRQQNLLDQEPLAKNLLNFLDFLPNKNKVLLGTMSCKLWEKVQVVYFLNVCSWARYSLACERWHRNKLEVVGLVCLEWVFCVTVSNPNEALYMTRSPDSLGFILWGTWMFVQNIKAVLLIVFVTFVSTAVERQLTNNL